MVVKIESPAPSCSRSLKYNEDKVARGDAVLVAYANLDNPDLQTIQEAFNRLERGRKYPVSSVSFHASINPSKEDLCNEDDIIQLSAGMMSYLGYGQQPFLIYRHSDIEREHYHIVSVRVDASGRKINDFYERKRLNAFLLRNELKHHYKVGRGKGESVENVPSFEEMVSSSPKFRRFNPRGEVKSQVLEIFNTALRYDFSSLSEFVFVMEDLGVSVNEIGERLSFQGLDRKGKKVTNILPEESLGVPAREYVNRAVEEYGSFHAGRYREKERVEGIVRAAFKYSKSEKHFENILSNKGIKVHLSRTRDTDEVFGITFVDHKTRTVFKASELRDAISVQMMRNAVSSGHWRIEDRGEGRRNSYVRESRRIVVAMRDEMSRGAMRIQTADVGKGTVSGHAGSQNERSGTGGDCREEDMEERISRSIH